MRCQTAPRSLHLLILAAITGPFGCGDAGTVPFVSSVDGNRPIVLALSAKLQTWAGIGGTPAGARARLLTATAPLVGHLWNPTASGAEQTVPVDLDDAPDGVCTSMNFSLWSVPGQPAIYVCPRWIFCTREADRSLFGPAGCLLHLAHELGHVLGATKHATQDGRPAHGGGPIMCSWASDCADATLKDYTAEDVALVCSDGGHGGRCP